MANYLGFRVGFQAIQPDTANPEVELFGGASVTREAGQAWAEPSAAGHDARDGNLTSSVTVSGTVDMNTTGTYILTLLRGRMPLAMRPMPPAPSR